ncbi:MAG TPA: sialidase family protein [Candidatus Babeliales bacterium]|nr:sialidase family protein [Candidatus Babeliales bacterium]
MSHKLFLKQSSILITGIALLSFSSVRPEDFDQAETRACAHSCDKWKAKTRNVGYPQDELPVPITHCQDRQLAIFADTLISHGAAAEPTLAVHPFFPNILVASWQQDRIDNSGALLAGIAYSFDGGKTWHRTTVPAVQTLTQFCTGGYIDRVSDVWLSFSRGLSEEEVLYLISLPFNITENLNTLDQQGVAANISPDGGKTWNGRQMLGTTQDAFNKPGSILLPFDDKPSVTADPNIPQNAYVVRERFDTVFSDHAPVLFNRTVDGGLTWSDFTVIYDPQLDTSTLPLVANSTFNNIIVVLPDCIACPLQGNLLNFMTRTLVDPNTGDSYFDIALIRSTDFGLTWDTEATVVLPAVKAEPNGEATVFTGGYTYDINGDRTGGVGTLMRTAESDVFDVNVNRSNGTIYVTFQTTQFREDFLPQIGLVVSRDGGVTWTPPVRVNRTPQNSPNPQAFTPAIASTESGDVAILFSDFRKSNNAVPTTDPKTKTNTWLDIYKDIYPLPGNTGVGLDFVQELRLSKHSYIAQNGPVTTSGVMTNGDYSFLVAQGRDFYAAFTQTHKGPFTPPEVFFVDPVTGFKLFVDDNFRQSPYVSVIKRKNNH